MADSLAEAREQPLDVVLMALGSVEVSEIATAWREHAIP